MLTPDVHPPRPGEPAAELDRLHHDHGPLGPDDFNKEPPTMTTSVNTTNRRRRAVDAAQSKPRYRVMLRLTSGLTVSAFNRGYDVTHTRAEAMELFYGAMQLAGTDMVYTVEQATQ